MPEGRPAIGEIWWRRRSDTGNAVTLLVGGLVSDAPPDSGNISRTTHVMARELPSPHPYNWSWDSFVTEYTLVEAPEGSVWIDFDTWSLRQVVTSPDRSPEGEVGLRDLDGNVVTGTPIRDLLRDHEPIGVFGDITAGPGRDRLAQVILRLFRTFVVHPTPDASYPLPPIHVAEVLRDELGSDADVAIRYMRGRMPPEEGRQFTRNLMMVAARRARANQSLDRLQSVWAAEDQGVFDALDALGQSPEPLGMDEAAAFGAASITRAEDERILAAMESEAYAQASPTLWDRLADEPGDGGKRDPEDWADPDTLGRIVRGTWVAWAREQPDVAEHPNWLTPWEDLPERDREVDRRIGTALLVHVVANEDGDDD